VAGGADRLVYLAGAGVSLDLLDLVLKAAHVTALGNLLDPLPLLVLLRHDNLLVDIAS
jgi:hypothetical protein